MENREHPRVDSDNTEQRKSDMESTDVVDGEITGEVEASVEEEGLTSASVTPQPSEEGFQQTEDAMNQGIESKNLAANLIDVKKQSIEVIDKSNVNSTEEGMNNVYRQLYLLGQLNEEAPPDVLPSYYKKKSDASSNKNRRKDSENSGSAKKKSVARESKIAKRKAKIPAETLRRGKTKRFTKNEKKIKKGLDGKLIGLSSSLQEKKARKRALLMGFDGAWPLADVLKVKSKKLRKAENRTNKLLGFFSLVRWMEKLCLTLKKLHQNEKDIALKELTIDSIFINRDLELLILQTDEMKVKASDAEKGYDILLMGIVLLQMLCSYFDVDFKVEDSLLSKSLSLEMKILLAKKGDADVADTAQELSEMTTFVQKEVKDIILTCTKGVPGTMIDVIVQSCSPERFNRRNAHDMAQCLKSVAEEIKRDPTRDLPENILISMLRNKQLEAKVRKLSNYEKHSELVIDSMLPVVSDAGIFGADGASVSKDTLTNSDNENYESDDSYYPHSAAEEEIHRLSQRGVKNDHLEKLQTFLQHTADHTDMTNDGTKSEQEEFLFPNQPRNRSRTLDRGYIKANRKTAADLAAEQVVHTDDLYMAKEVMNQTRNLKKLLEGIDPEDLAQQFEVQKRLTPEEAIALVRKATDIFREEPNLLSLKAPINIVGDIHGQYFDLRHMMKSAGQPGELLPGMIATDDAEDADDDNWVNNQRSFLFLGDYVDRGMFSCEVILYLFALKIKYPAQVWMLRGNHESRVVSSHFGFKAECMQKYGVRFFNACALAFQSLPIGAVVATETGKWLCIHGGISREVRSLYQFTEIDRFAEPALQGFLCDVLWSDPIGDDMLSRYTAGEFMSMEYHQNIVRGCSCKYGYRALLQFLASNELVGIIRAHEVQQQGYRVHFKNLVGRGANEPLVLTVFSAPNYCGRYSNKAAYVTLENTCESGKESDLGRTIYKAARNQAKQTIRKITKKNQKGNGGFLGFFRKPKKVPVTTLIEEERNKAIEELNYKRIWPLDLVNVHQFSDVRAPQLLMFDSANDEERLSLEMLCPYMPSDAYSFVVKSIEMSDALQSGRASYGRSVRRSMVELGLDTLKALKEPPSPRLSTEGPRSLHKSGSNRSLTASRKNWKALQLLGLDENSSSRSLGVSSKEEEDLKRYERAASIDSINEMNPARVREKFENAKRSLTNLPAEFVFEEENEEEAPRGMPTPEVVEDEEPEQEQEPAEDLKNEEVKKKDSVQSIGLKKKSTGNEKVKFARKEILALKTLFLLVDRADKGSIEAQDLFDWAQDYNGIAKADCNTCVQLVDFDRDGVIGFQDYLVFAAKCKRKWMADQLKAAMEEHEQQEKAKAAKSGTNSSALPPKKKKPGMW